jgi:hypothetical protein
VDITVYLPDEVAQRAKAQNVNLSRVLRDALTTQFAEEDAVSATLEQASTVTLELQTDEGRAYRGRMEATLIGEDATTGTAVYLRRNGEVIAYREEDRRFRTVADPASELAAVLPTNAYIAAMDALGIVPEVDLDSGLVAATPAAGTAAARPRTTGQKLRAVPGDLVEPPVKLLKRLAGHGDAPKAGEPTADVPTLSEPEVEADEPEAEPEVAPEGSSS